MTRSLASPPARCPSGSAMREEECMDDSAARAVARLPPPRFSDRIRVGAALSTIRPPDLYEPGGETIGTLPQTPEPGSVEPGSVVCARCAGKCGPRVCP